MRGTTFASRPVTAEAAVLAAIDAALATAAHRSFFTCDEAATAFHDVAVAVRDPTASAAARSMFDDALLADGAELLERSRVVDVLLDVRLLVTSRG
jgi:hypothetical protein